MFIYNLWSKSDIKINDEDNNPWTLGQMIFN